ncbi:MAG: LysR family transcriptional regulator [Rhodospirillaceae bacterium]|nr:LysR family transcriptional regulator [Rhodospirillaceae bacterium]
MYYDNTNWLSPEDPMELRQLQHFLAVVEEGNFHRAAAKVHLTQQAVSKSIAQLETNLGVRLLDRDRQSVALSPFGELLLPHAKTVDAEVRRFHDNLATMLGTKTGIVRVGATPTMLNQLLPEALHRLHAARPQLKLHVESGDFDRLAGTLLRGELDVVFSTEPSEAADELIALERLCEDHNIVAAKPGHPLARAKTAKAKDLAAYPWLAIANFPKADQDFKSLFAADKIKPPHPAVSTSSVVFALNWLLQSEFLCVMPRQLVSRELDNGTLVEIATPLKPRAWPLVVAYRKNATRSPATLALIDVAKTVAKQM